MQGGNSMNAQQLADTLIVDGNNAAVLAWDEYAIEQLEGLHGDEHHARHDELDQLWSEAAKIAKGASPHRVATAMGYLVATNRHYVCLTRKGEESLVIPKAQFERQFVPACNIRGA